MIATAEEHMNLSTKRLIKQNVFRFPFVHVIGFLILLVSNSAWNFPQQISATGENRVGSKYNGGTFVTTGQTVKPAGKTIAFAGRPVDLVLSADSQVAYVKKVNGLVIVDADSMKIRQEVPFDKEEGGSMHGITVSSDGKRIYLTSSGSLLWEARLNDSSKWYWSRRIDISGSGQGDSYPCGVAVSADGSHAYVALSRSNSLAIVDLDAGKLEAEVAVGVAPFDVVLSPDGKIAYVSNWGGRRPSHGERVMKSSGTETLVDEHGLPTSGTVSAVDLTSRAMIESVAVGLHPSGMVLRHDGSLLFIANANSDNVSIINTKTFKVLETIKVRPDAALPFGSITNAVALSTDGKILYAANGGNNAVGVISLGDVGHRKSKVLGFIPTGWFPAALAVDGKRLFVANAKGEGSRQADSATHKWHVKWQRGTMSQIPVPGSSTLAKYTKEVRELSLVRQSLDAFKPAQRGVKPVPIPKHAGEPSVFRHVVYVLKENRCYDQVFGDMKQGNNDPDLCIYGRDVTPNHHAVAEQFVLLDNYYCSGIVSADGHQWATQGITTDYQEKAWGTWSRSYDFGSDPLAFAPTNFIWDNALLHGLSFRNYGEFDFPAVEPDTVTWPTVYDDFINKKGKVSFRPWVPLEPLVPYTCPTYPGWNLRIPDAVRLDRFMREFEQYEKNGDWPNLVFVYLPQDHTSGNQIGAPTPRAHVADNDLAVGGLIEAISKSPFWQNTCIFVNEDDPQNGFDHVDGHRSLCLVVSPYTKRGKVISKFYNQSSVLHTIERILGLPPMNQLDALAPTMEDCFTPHPDFTPYAALPNTIPLDEMNKHASIIDGKQSPDRTMGEMFDFSRPDRIDDDLFNRVLWFSAKGPDMPYPERFAGAHGRGLKALHLRLDSAGREDE